jgi:hypothetical protein
VRRPVVAGLADLLLPPLGHFYVGAPQRGITLWIGGWLVLTIGALATVRVPGLALAVLVATIVLALAIFIALLVDAFQVARRQGRDYQLRRYNRWYVYIVVACVGWLVSTLMRDGILSHVQAFRLPSGSMAPTLLAGDHLYVDKDAYGRRPPRRGELVVVP